MNFGTNGTATLAAICTTDTGIADATLCTLSQNLLNNAYRVVGVQQKPLCPTIVGQSTGCNATLGFSIGGTQAYDISQHLGAGSSSCNLDTESLEQAAYDICKSITPETDLVIVNRFGKRESLASYILIRSARGISSISPSIKSSGISTPLTISVLPSSSTSEVIASSPTVM